MSRFLVAHLPSFRLDRCGWGAADAVALVCEEHQTTRVLAVSPAAARAGVRAGMVLAEARALLPTLLAEPFDAAGESEDLSALAAQLLRVSPAVAPLPPAAVVASLDGLVGARAPGGEEALASAVQARLEALGHTARVAIADDPQTALLVAVWSAQAQTRVPRGAGAEALAPLPLGALELPPGDAAWLDTLGVRDIGAFGALPAAALAGRVGGATLAAHAVASGRAPAPQLPPATEGRPLGLTQALPDAVTDLDALLFVLNALVRGLCTRLTARAEAAPRVEVHLQLGTGALQIVPVGVGAPTRDPQRLFSLVRARLASFQAGGPVEAVGLHCPAPAPWDGLQQDLLARQRSREAVAEVVARLEDALGASALGMPRLLDRHRPEAAWALGPASPGRAGGAPREGAEGPGPVDARAGGRPPAADPVWEWEGVATPPPPVRPSLLLPAPLAVDVRTGPGGRPQAVRVGARWCTVAMVEGPERLGGEWWSRPFDRTYWSLTLDDGRVAWVCREDGTWALQGWWDHPRPRRAP
jgi:protein ImuB